MISKHVRSKSDTDFHINQEYLNTIHTNLKSFQESQTELVSPILKNSTEILNPDIPQTSNSHKKIPSIIEKDPNTIEELVQTFYNFLKDAIIFKVKCDRKVITGFISNQKFHINTILILIHEYIIRFKTQHKNNEELINNLNKFERVLQALIDIKPEEYYQELKTMILNEFEKTRYEIIQSIKRDKDKYPSLFPLIIAISQAILFVLSIVSYKLDYYSLTINCLVQRIKQTIIIFLESTGKEKINNLSPKSLEKELKAILILVHFFSLERSFTQEFYRKGESNLSINAFSSFGRYILSNLIQMMARDDELTTSINQIKKKSLFIISRESGITMRNFIGRMCIGGKSLNTTMGKFFRLYFTIKLVVWKNAAIEVDKDKKNKPEICRICEQKIPIDEFIMHIVYCKEQRVFYEQMKNANDKLGIYICMFESYIGKIMKKENKRNFFSLNDMSNEIPKMSTFDNDIFLIFGKKKEEIFKKCLEIYRREKEKQFDYYEKKPEKVPDIYSIIYLSFFVYFLNKNCNDYSQELNEIFSGLLSCLLNSAIAIKYILTIKEGRTKSNMKKKKTNIINLEKNFTEQSKSLNGSPLRKKTNSSLNVRPGTLMEKSFKVYLFPEKLNLFRAKLSISSKQLSLNTFQRGTKRSNTISIKTNPNQSEGQINLNGVKPPVNLTKKLIYNSKSSIFSQNGAEKEEKKSTLHKEGKAKNLAKKLFLLEKEEMDKEDVNFSIKNKFQKEEEEKEYFFFQRKTEKNNTNDSSTSGSNIEKMNKISMSSNECSPVYFPKRSPAKNIKKSLFRNTITPEIEYFISKDTESIKVLGLSSEEEENTEIYYDNDSIIISPKTKPNKSKEKEIPKLTSEYKPETCRGYALGNILNYHQFGNINHIFSELVKEIEKENKLLLKQCGALIFSDSESDDDNTEISNDTNNTKQISFATKSPSINYAVTTSILDFDFVVEIAKGGYGHVDLYKKKTTGDFYSIKSVNINSMKERNLSETLKNETLILNQINNNYVVRCYYIFKDKMNFYYVMEFMPGGDLYKLLSKYTLTQKTIQLIVAEVVLALEYLHSMKIIHRDIKPENILICKEGHFKLTDFGLSESNEKKKKNTFVIGGKDELFIKEEEKEKDNEGDNTNDNNNNNNHAVGTLNYMAPELFTEEYETTYAVDYWALGILLYELYTFKVPFNAETAKETKNQIINMRIDWSEIESKEIRDTYSNIEDAIDLIKKFIVKNPNERWGDKNIEDIKVHKFFKGFNWNKIKDVKSSEVLMHVKSLIVEMNKKIKLASKNPKHPERVFDENMQIPEDITPIGRMKQFGCVRVDNLYDKSIDVLNKRIKLKEVEINEDNTVSLIEDLK